MKIVLQGRPVSWNVIYSASSYWTRKLYADELHTQVRMELIRMGYKIQKIEQYFKNKVDIDIVAYFKTRPLDSDNIPAKLYIDGLKSILIGNDTFRDVGRVSVESVLGEDNRIEIDIIERKEV